MILILTAHIFLLSIHVLVFIIQTAFVLCEVGTVVCDVYDRDISIMIIVVKCKAFHVAKHQVERWISAQSALNILTLREIVSPFSWEDRLDVCFIGCWVDH